MATADVNKMCPLTVIKCQADVIVTKLLVIWKVNRAVCDEEFDINPVDMELLEFKETGALTTELLAGTCGIRGTAEFACADGSADKDCASTSRLRNYRELRRFSAWNGSESLTYFLLLRFERTDRTLLSASWCVCLWNFLSNQASLPIFFFCFLCQRGIFTPFVGLEFKRIYVQLLVEFETTGHEV